MADREPYTLDQARRDVVAAALRAIGGEMMAEIAEGERLVAAGKGTPAGDGFAALLPGEVPLAVQATREFLDELRARAAAPAEDADAWVVECLETRGDDALFWRPNDHGYTTDLSSAGRYSREEAEKRARHGDRERAHRLSDVMRLARPRVDRDELRRAASAPKEDARVA